MSKNAEYQEAYRKRREADNAWPTSAAQPATLW